MGNVDGRAFPLAELTGRVDGPSTRLVETGLNCIDYGKVETESGDAVRLLRLRNPWGQGHGEWCGAWADNAPEWKSVNEADRRHLDVQFSPDGEFWMPLDDYIKYFHTTSVCSLAPDFDRDGLDDGLSQ